MNVPQDNSRFDNGAPIVKPALKVVVVVNNHNSLRVVEMCEGIRKYRPVEIHIVCQSSFEATYGASFEARGIKRLVIDAGGAGRGALNAVAEVGKKVEKLSSVPNKTGIFARLKYRLAHLAFQSSLVGLLRERMILRRLRAQQRKMVEYIQTLRPHAVLSMSDRSHDYVEAPLLWAARACGVKIVLPYVAQYDVDAAIEYRKTPEGKLPPELSVSWPPSLYKLMTRLRLGDQIYRGCFFQAAYVLNANRKACTLSKYPWWVGNGISDVVCVDSRYSAERYASHRVAESKVAIIGHVAYDDVHASWQNREAVRQRLIDEYELSTAKKILVLSVPQYAEQGFITWEKHWAKIREIAAAIALSKQNCLLSVHPRSDLENYRFLERDFDFHILRESLAKVIGAADLFLASNSTTFAWAALSGVPSIALWSPVPFLHGHLKSIRLVDAAADLPDAIAQCLQSPPHVFDDDWNLLSRDRVFDGRFTERFAQLLVSTLTRGCVP